MQETVAGIAAQGDAERSVTLCRTVSWRGGHVLGGPMVRDFELVVALSGPASRTSAFEEAFARLFAIVGAELGHAMLCRRGDAAAGRPVRWPAGAIGPRLELREWAQRPTLASIADWIAVRAAGLAEDLGAGEIRVAAVELRDGAGGAAVVSR